MSPDLDFRMRWPTMTLPLPKCLGVFNYWRYGATWRSGYATVCKTVYPGSIPGVASTHQLFLRAFSPRHASAKRSITLPHGDARLERLSGRFQPQFFAFPKRTYSAARL